MTTIIGIDPGLSGAIAVFEGETLTIDDMPTHTVVRGGKEKRELDRAVLASFLRERESLIAYVEQVGAMPGQGVTSMFSFGKSYGTVLGILAAYGIPTFHVTPQAWRKALQVRPGKDGSRLRASELMPQFADMWPLKKHDGRAEAALIAYYGLQQQRTTT